MKRVSSTRILFEILLSNSPLNTKWNPWKISDPLNKGFIYSWSSHKVLCWLNLMQWCSKNYKRGLSCIGNFFFLLFWPFLAQQATHINNSKHVYACVINCMLSSLMMLIDHKKIIQNEILCHSFTWMFNGIHFVCINDF